MYPLEALKALSDLKYKGTEELTTRFLDRIYQRVFLDPVMKLQDDKTILTSDNFLRALKYLERDYPKLLERMSNPKPVASLPGYFAGVFIEYLKIPIVKKVTIPSEIPDILFDQCSHDEYFLTELMRLFPKDPRVKKSLLKRGDGDMCIHYICYYLKSSERWLEAEPLMLDNAGINELIKYATYNIKHRWAELETLWVQRFKNRQPHILLGYITAFHARLAAFENNIKRMGLPDYFRYCVILGIRIPALEREEWGERLQSMDDLEIVEPLSE